MFLKASILQKIHYSKNILIYWRFPLYRPKIIKFKSLTSCNVWQYVLQLPGDDACVVINSLLKTAMAIVNSKVITSHY